MTTRSWVQHPITGKLIPRAEYVRPGPRTHYVQGDIESFVSPVTKEVISDRGKLRDHMREHGITNSSDYSPEFLHDRRLKREAEMTGQTEAAREERKALLREELNRRGI